MSYLEGKKVVITGGSSGIGAYLARELAHRGAKVGLLARRQDKLEQVVKSIRDQEGVAFWRLADVADEQALHNACDALAMELGGCDIVVANAGYGEPESLNRYVAGRATAMYRTNLMGTLFLLDWALPRFLEAQAGHIVGIASVASYFGLPRSFSYCGSKAAMRIHLQGLRVSTGRHGIAVTTLCPGFVESELTAERKVLPFLWPTDRAARRIANAIERRRAEDVFPWQMNLIVNLLTRFPLRFREWILRRMH